jgi:hypothetical protein
MPFSTRTIEAWNRRLHFYVGLYFLFFLWLFSLTGLMLNHGQWAVSLAANHRTETRYERPVTVPASGSDVERARAVMNQLNLVGEIEMPNQQPAGSLSFSTSRPADSNQVRVNLERRLATVQHFEHGHLGRFRTLHTFSGSRYNQPTSQRDWIVTTLWVWAMDALAAGLIVMILGSYYMWWRLKKRHAAGLASLSLGFIACAWFVSGLF